MAVYTIFGQTGGGTVAANSGGFTLGVQFSISAPATLTGYYWYSVSGVSILPNACGLWTTADGNAVSGAALTPTWSGAAGSGWVRAGLSGGPTLAASTNYTAGICSPGGGNWFSDTSGYWTTGAGSGGITSGIITAPNNASATHGQNPDNSGASIAFPQTSSSGFNFWIDIELTTSSGVSATFTLAMAPLAESFTAAEQMRGQFGLGMAPLRSAFTAAETGQNISAHFGLGMAPLGMRFSQAAPGGLRVPDDDRPVLKRWRRRRFRL